MALLNEEIQNQVRPILAGMQAPVKLVMFTQGSGGGEVAIECTMCASAPARRGGASLSEKIMVEVSILSATKSLPRTTRSTDPGAGGLAGWAGQITGSYVRTSGYEFSCSSTISCWSAAAPMT
jgi:hypothetical protein